MYGRQASDNVDSDDAAIALTSNVGGEQVPVNERELLCADCSYAAQFGALTLIISGIARLAGRRFSNVIV